MALSRSSHRFARALSTAVVSAAAFAGVLLASRSASAQGYYQYDYGRPPPPPPRGYYYGSAPPPPPRYYAVDREPPYALQLGLDLEGAVPVGVNVPQGDLSGGGGFKVRVGEQLSFPGIRFTPEVGYGYDHLWANDAAGNQYGWDMNRIFGGARLAFGRILVPVVYAHVGYGWRQTAATYVTGGNGGLAYDVGGALDLRVIPHFGFGAHLEYAAIDIPYQPQWVALGLHADLIF
jgi:hypothetical protein